MTPLIHGFHMAPSGITLWVGRTGEWFIFVIIGIVLGAVISWWFLK